MSLILSEAAYAEQLNAELEAKVDKCLDKAERWNRELKQIDPSLSLVLGKENVDDSELKASYWHIRQRVPGFADGYICLQGPNGEWREPGAWMIDMLLYGDLWNDRARRDRGRIRRRLAEAKERARQTEKEQRWDEASLAMRAAKRLKDPMGFTKRSDLKASKATLAHRRKLARDNSVAPGGDSSASEGQGTPRASEEGKGTL